MLSLGDFRVTVMRRLVLAALQVRFNVGARQAPLFQFVEFNLLDSPREACAVCSLDLTADAAQWRTAVATAVREIRRLGSYGLSDAELKRYSVALLSDSAQLAAMDDRIAHNEQLQQLMEAVACAHTFMAPVTAQSATEAVRRVLLSRGFSRI